MSAILGKDIDCLDLETRSGLAWFRTGGWKIRKYKSETSCVGCVLCGDSDDWVHILLKCCATERWRRSWWGMSKFHGDSERNEELGVKILRDNRSKLQDALGNFISKVRRLREFELKKK